MFVLINSSQISSPPTDVVGGSSLFGTRTLQLALMLLQILILSGLLGLIYKEKTPIPALALKIGRSVRERTNIYYREVSQGTISMPRLLIIIFFLLAMSKYLTYVALGFNKNNVGLVLNPFGLETNKTNNTLFVIALLGTFYLTQIVFKKHSLVDSLSTFLIFATPILLLLGLCNTTYLFISSDIQSRLTFYLLILLFSLIVCIVGIKRNFFNLDKLRNIGIYAGIFLLIARIPQAPSDLDPFEDFPFLNSFAFREWGYKPWADLQLNHGLYHDLLRPLLGTYLIDNSVWGMQTGISLILFPLEIVLVIFLATKILNSNYVPIYLFLTFIAFSRTLPTEGDNSWIYLYSLPRAIPLLICTYALKLSISKLNLANISILSLTNFVALIWAAENMILVLIILAVLSYSILTNMTESLKKRLYLMIITLILPILYLIIFLNVINLRVPFFSDYEGLTANLLQGNLPFNFRSGLGYAIFTLGLPIIFVYFTFRYGQKLRTGLQQKDLIMIPSLALGVYYYVKFLAWPDLHIQQSTNALYLIWTAAGIGFYTRISKSLSSRASMKTAFIMVLVMVFTPNLYPNRQVQPKIDGKEIPGIGKVSEDFSASSTEIYQLMRDIRALSKNKNPIVLDFSNAPVDVNLRTQFKFVPDLLFTSFYVTRIQQELAIESIRKSSPDVIVLLGPRGLSNGIFPGEMYLRNYLISEYLFKNYKHVSKSGPYLLLSKNSGNLFNLNANTLLPSNYLRCNWEKSLNTVPSLSKIPNDSQTNIESIDLLELSVLNGIRISEVVGFVVESSISGSIEIISGGGFPSVEFEVVVSENLRDLKQRRFIPVRSCPSWALNNSQLGELSVTGNGTEIKSVYVVKK